MGVGWRGESGGDRDLREKAFESSLLPFSFSLSPPCLSLPRVSIQLFVFFLIAFSSLIFPPFRLHRNLASDSARPHGYVSARPARAAPLCRREGGVTPEEEEGGGRKRETAALPSTYRRFDALPLSNSVSPFLSLSPLFLITLLARHLTERKHRGRGAKRNPRKPEEMSGTEGDGNGGRRDGRGE